MLNNLYSKVATCRKCVDDPLIGSLISQLEKFLFLPSRLEVGIPKYVFIAMEPTDTWCISKDQGTGLLNEGFVNFYYSESKRNLRGPFLLQFVAQNFLCDRGETYLMTDLAKFAMPTDGDTDITSLTREMRFRNCEEYLIEELKIFNPKRIFAVGGAAWEFVQKQDWFSSYKSRSRVVYHYSGRCHSFFKAYCETNKDKFLTCRKKSCMEERIKSFCKRRMEEIKFDPTVVNGSRAHAFLEEALTYNNKSLTEADWRMIFYYASELKK